MTESEVNMFVKVGNSLINLTMCSKVWIDKTGNEFTLYAKSEHTEVLFKGGKKECEAAFEEIVNCLNYKIPLIKLKKVS